MARFVAHHRYLRCCCRPSLSPLPSCTRYLSTTKPSSDDESISSLKRSNRAQEYESRHATGLYGFNTHDGPVPTRRRADHSLIDPFFTPHQPDQTHLIQGGTPYDQNVGPEYRLADYGESSVYTLILLRHGESEWNQQNRYTGWVDVNLTKQGEKEAHAAGRLLAENEIEVDHAFTSVLKRASYTLEKCLAVAGQQ